MVKLDKKLKDIFLLKQELNKLYLHLYDKDYPEESAHRILCLNPDIIIHHNDETGEWLYSVVLDWTDLWLASFKTKKEAVNYVKKYKPIFQFADDKKYRNQSSRKNTAPLGSSS